MAEQQVAEIPQTQSPAVETPVVDTQATDQQEDIATWKRRLAGKDQALTAAKKAAEEFQSKYEELAKWKAAQEEASLSEFERVERRAKELERQLEDARKTAEQEKLRSQYPKYFEFSEQTRALDEEQRAAQFESLMKQYTEADASQAPRDANSPKRSVQKEGKMSPDKIKDALKALGNPWLES
jgi:hypothetical protein